jgi:peptidoglycan L-alanyl-D-glutamate endopeptidase CwlK
VVERAIVLTAQDFAVHDGVREQAEQAALVAAGASRTMNSKHKRQSDGYGHAVDLVPFIAGRSRWDWPGCYRVAVAMRAAAIEAGLALTWGGVWDRDLRDLPADPDGMAAAVAGYQQRKGGHGFVDGPHFELRA